MELSQMNFFFFMQVWLYNLLPASVKQRGRIVQIVFSFFRVQQQMPVPPGARSGWQHDWGQWPGRWGECDGVNTSERHLLGWWRREVVLGWTCDRQDWRKKANTHTHKHTQREMKRLWHHIIQIQTLFQRQDHRQSSCHKPSTLIPDDEEHKNAFFFYFPVSDLARCRLFKKAGKDVRVALQMEDVSTWVKIKFKKEEELFEFLSTGSNWGRWQKYPSGRVMPQTQAN